MVTLTTTRVRDLVLGTTGLTVLDVWRSMFHAGLITGKEQMEDPLPCENMILYGLGIQHDEWHQIRAELLNSCVIHDRDGVLCWGCPVAP